MSKQTVTVALDMEGDLHNAGLPTDDETIEAATEAWMHAATIIAAKLGVELVVVTDAQEWDRCNPTHDQDGNVTVAGRIWQGAHWSFDVSPDGRVVR